MSFNHWKEKNGIEETSDYEDITVMKLYGLTT